MTSDGATTKEAVVAPPRARDDARLRAIVDDHFGFVARSLRGLGVVDADVDDAAQQVFLVVARRLAEIERGREASFLFQTALRIASRSRRGRARRREAGDDDIEVVDQRASPEELIDQRRARAMLDRVLEDMDDELRAVFVLYEIEEMTSPQIADLLEIPLGTVASRLRRAREDFHARARRFAKGGVR
jgi:RNA polymerase sigma-70 factor (ECF subfamily)